MDKRRLIPIFAIVFTQIMGAGVILPILPLLAEGDFGASAFQATMLNAVFFGAQFLAAPLLGRLSDRVGRRPVLIVSQIGTVASYGLFIAAAPLGQIIDGWGLSIGMGGGLLMLYVARVLDGLTGGNITTAQAYISDISTEENRAQALGIISAAFGVGFIFGPAFGGFLAEISFVAPFIGAAVITSGSLLLTIVLLEESLPPEERSQHTEEEKRPSSLTILRNQPTVLLIIVITLTLTMAFSALQSTFALYAERILFTETPSGSVARNVGLILAVIGFFTVLTQGFLIKPLVNNLGERKVVLVGISSVMITFIGLSIVSTPFLATVFSIPLAIGNGLNQPSLQSLITRFGSKKTQGETLGLYQSARSLALILGPIWSGYTFQEIGPRAPYIIAIPLIVVAFGLASWLLKRPIPSEQEAPAPS